MKKPAVSLCWLFMLLGLTLPVFGQTDGVVPEIPHYFAVAFEQNGRLIPISNHQVVLEKKSFSIVLYFKQPENVLVNASFTADSYNQARSGASFDNIKGFSDLGMAEEPFNPNTLLMLSNYAPHYWYYENNANHRFNDVKSKNGILICRRIVGQIMYRDTNRKHVSIKDMTETTLYLVFMRTQWTQGFRQQIEKQREFIKVIFR
ncbi:hypothetical protein CSA56_11280 [candidate division KSB3 bacterium]|uniref:Uncharacterized protein n=1 Tax=candidate division KSB3 bacterium TaxID=2044937 RepID=A0A2G6KCW6_9BACT|nr:MAG: hypothetical protein CSA56_11280 [candidate division KSB3 bacterium]